jgi:hypothetical protein
LRPHVAAILQSKQLPRIVSECIVTAHRRVSGTLRRVTEHKMTNHARLCFALAFTATSAALGLGVERVSAADDCVTESNAVPPKGYHWQFRIDRATNRKCWRMVALLPHPHRPPVPSAGAATKPSDAHHFFVRAATKPNDEHRASVRGASTPSDEHRLSESERAALFLEFLRWKEQHGSAVEPTP